MPIVVVGVTTYQGGREDRPQGEGAQVVDRQSPCGTRNAESQRGTAYYLSPLGNKLDCWRARVIRKRSCFVRRGATGKGPLQDGTSPVAYSTCIIRSRKRTFELSPPASLKWSSEAQPSKLQGNRSQVPENPHVFGQQTMRASLQRWQLSAATDLFSHEQLAG